MKALALISGGLDSTLALELIQRQGIEVIGLYFQIPFCGEKKEALSNLGIEVRRVDIKEAFLRMFKNPRFGFGANMNPCIDCKILMLQHARELMPQLGAQFVVTGEVLGQRPMSQNKPALKLIEKKAGLEGCLLRPLSAKLLPETLPEKEGWIDRNRLMGFSGRGRNPQIALAREFNLKSYAQPAGGCLLTDPRFSQRLKDLISHQELSSENIELLKLGRHFRLAQKVKLIVGRDEEENGRLVNLAQDNDYLFMPTEIAGPTVLGRGIFNNDLIQLACGITSRYCDMNGSASADINYYKKGDCPFLLKATPLEESKLISLRV